MPVSLPDTSSSNGCMTTLWRPSRQRATTSPCSTPDDERIDSYREVSTLTNRPNNAKESTYKGVDVVTRIPHARYSNHLRGC